MAQDAGRPIAADAVAAYLKWWQRVRTYGRVELTVQAGEIVYIRIEGTAKDLGGLKMWTLRAREA